MKYLVGIVASVVLSAGIFPPLSFANSTTSLNREEAFSIVQNGHEVQVSLSEKERSKEEINKLMNPFFTNQYRKQFSEENIVKMENGYVAFGSDFAGYYIPFFSYTNETLLGFNHANETWYVYEFYPARSDGPVGYPDHYEAIGLKQVNGKWKVASWEYDFNPDVVKKESPKPQKKSNKQNLTLRMSFVGGINHYFSTWFTGNLMALMQ